MAVAFLVSGCSGWGQPAYTTPHIDGEPVTEAEWLRAARNDPLISKKGRYGLGRGSMGRDE